MSLPPALTALRHRNFRLIWIGLLLSFIGTWMQNAALLWNVSLLVSPERKGLALGLVGLFRFFPIVIFSIISGVVADAADRRKLMLLTQTGSAIVAVGLAALAFSGNTAVWPVYALAALSSAVGAFDLPARQSLVPSLVPREDLPNAISLNTIMQQTSQVLGPALGGIVIATSSVGWAYIFNAVSFVAVIVALLMMRDAPGRPEHPVAHDALSWRAALEGMRFVFHSPLIRSTMLLDFFATFFSSATALLPIFAADILHAGPEGLGVLRAAPSVGAVLMSLALAHQPPIGRSGRALLLNVGLFGLAMIGFGLSRSFALSAVLLAASGAVDMVSVVIRSTLLQIATPQALFGRVSAVNQIFIGSSNEIGAFESGVAARLMGTVPSVVFGGTVTLVVVAVTAWKVPALRRLGRLDQLREK